MRQNETTTRIRSPTSSSPIVFVVKSNWTELFDSRDLRSWRSQPPATAAFYSTRRKSEIEFRDYYLVIPFSNVRRAWSPSGVRLRGSPKAPWLRFSVRGSSVPGWLYFSRKCKDLSEIVSGSACDAHIFFKCIETNAQFCL